MWKYAVNFQLSYRSRLMFIQLFASSSANYLIELQINWRFAVCHKFGPMMPSVAKEKVGDNDKKMREIYLR